MWELHTNLALPPELGFELVAGQLFKLSELATLTVGQQSGELLLEAALLLAELSAVETSPLAEAALLAIREAGSSNVVLVAISERAVARAVRWLRIHAISVKVVEKQDLASMDPVRRLVLLGAPRWYPQATVTAPRAELTEFLQYGWLGRPRSAEGLLPVDSKGVARPIGVAGELRAPMFDPDDLPPSPNWDAISVAAAEKLQLLTDESDELVPARVVILSGDSAVLLSTDPEGEVTCAVLVGERVEIERISSNLLEVGMYLVLRTSGSDTDFIRELADRRFGAAPFRSQLESWKRPLRERLAVQGARRVQNALRKLGARAANVRYWASPRFIKPQSAHDFLVLLRYLGLEDKGPQLLSASERILEAHLQAGWYVRQQLQLRITRVALVELRGELQVELEEGAGGSMSVFRVLQISPDEFSVASSIIRRPFMLSETDWLG
jgi:hypothetical protein